MKKLFHNLVIVLVQDQEDMEKGGLTIPPSAEDTSRYALVVKAGDECSKVKEGDKILCKANAGEDIFLDGVPHILMTERDVIGIV